MKNFWSEIWQSFIRVNGPIFGLIAAVVGVAGFFVLPDSTMPIKWAILTSVIIALSFAVLVDLTVHAYQAARRPLPAVTTSYLENGILLLLLGPSELFAIGVLVSIYWLDRDFEIQIGIGSVTNVQTNGRIQVRVERMSEPPRPELWQRIQDRETAVLKSILVRPSVPLEVLRGLGE